MSELPKVKTIDFVAGRHYQHGNGEPFLVTKVCDKYWKYKGHIYELNHAYYLGWDFIQRPDLNKSTIVQQDLKELLK